MRFERQQLVAAAAALSLGCDTPSEPGSDAGSAGPAAGTSMASSSATAVAGSGGRGHEGAGGGASTGGQGGAGDPCPAISGAPIVDLHGGNLTILAVREGGSVYCWGDNSAGQCDATSQYTLIIGDPFKVTFLPCVESARAGSAGVAIMRNGRSVVTWGSDAWGERGDGPSASPLNEPSELPLVATQIDTTSFGAAALDDHGQVWLWGDHFRSVSNVPILSPMTETVTLVATSSGFSCALDAVGAVWCWGSNRYGQLGRDGVEKSLEPTRVPLTEQAIYVDTEPVTACAVLASGGIECWGDNPRGMLGVDPAELDYSSEPVAIDLPDFAISMELGLSGACAWTAQGRVFCWGFNSAFRFAPEEEDQGYGVVELPELEGASRVALAEYEVCALIDGGVKCRVAERNLPRRAIWLEFDDE